MEPAESGRPVSASAAALTGQSLTADRIAQAADLAAQAARPRTDHRGSAEYKRHMVRTFVTRLLDRTDTAAERCHVRGDLPGVSRS